MIAEQLDMGKPLIFEIPNILTEAECHQWIDRIRSTGTEPAPINTTRGAQIDAQIRNNRRVIFDDAEWANDLFDRVINNAEVRVLPGFDGQQWIAEDREETNYESLSERTFLR
jgi:hypothetical protein